MQTMSIVLSDQLKEFVDSQLASGRFSTASEYVRDLITEDAKRKAQDKLEVLLLEGMQGGKPSKLTAKDWTEIRAAALKQFEMRKGRKPA